MISRRQFVHGSLAGIAAAGTGRILAGEARAATPRRLKEGTATVSLVRTRDRKAGVRRAIDLLAGQTFRGRQVIIKPNFNSADPAPGSTHQDTLCALLESLQDMGAQSISIGERSGFAGFLKTEKIMAKKGVFDLAKRHGSAVINFDGLRRDDWVRIRPEGGHWNDGFDFARPLLDTDAVVSTCCLKTHRFGGHFTMSLKLSVGAVKTSHMTELHASFLSMRKMIGEINTAYSPSLIVLDGVDAFTDGGPDTGVVKAGNVILAGDDRVAVDAVGVAILKELGSNDRIMSTQIFHHDQIARAVELGIGVTGPEKIEIVTGDEESRAYAGVLTSILRQG